jgi:RimJ/RimL family protein N-acetyltransferase
VIGTERLRLRTWRESDRDAFAMLNAAPEVTWDLGGPLDRTESDAKFDRYVATFERHGVMPSRHGHPLGPHADIGWRLVHAAWGQGYATEAAKASLRDVFARVRLKEVLAYTSADNVRSRAVIQRLKLQRAASLDYSEPLGAGMWQGMVWRARPEDDP